MPRATSRAIEPVGITSMGGRTSSPRRMTAPLPNDFSICPMTESRDFAFWSTVAVLPPDILATVPTFHVESGAPAFDPVASSAVGSDARCRHRQPSRADEQPVDVVLEGVPPVDEHTEHVFETAEAAPRHAGSAAVGSSVPGNRAGRRADGAHGAPDLGRGRLRPGPARPAHAAAPRRARPPRHGARPERVGPRSSGNVPARLPSHRGVWDAVLDEPPPTRGEPEPG